MNSKTHHFLGNTLWLHHTKLYSDRGSEFIEYGLLDKDQNVIFHGKDFDPSPFIKSRIGKDAAKECMSFLILKPGDTDAEYFKNYTKKQLDWVNEWSDQISGEIYE
jgi:hypothetical protein